MSKIIKVTEQDIIFLSFLKLCLTTVQELLEKDNVRYCVYYTQRRNINN